MARADFATAALPVLRAHGFGHAFGEQRGQKLRRLAHQPWRLRLPGATVAARHGERLGPDLAEAEGLQCRGRQGWIRRP